MISKSLVVVVLMIPVMLLFQFVNCQVFGTQTTTVCQYGSYYGRVSPCDDFRGEIQGAPHVLQCMLFGSIILRAPCILSKNMFLKFPFCKMTRSLLSFRVHYLSQETFLNMFHELHMLRLKHFQGNIVFLNSKLEKCRFHFRKMVPENGNKKFFV